MNLYIIAGMIGPWQVILVVLVILLLFGGRKLPELMKGLGQGLQEFKKATKEGKEKEKDKDKDKEEDQKKINDSTE